MNGEPYTEEELQMIEELYPKMGKRILDLLPTDRTRDALYKQANRMGLRRDNWPEVVMRRARHTV